MKETLQTVLENELTEQLGYDKYEYSDEEKTNYRNGYYKKTVHSTNVDIELNILKDRNGKFGPIIIEKGSKDILILCTNDLKELPEAISTAYPNTEFKRCIVHMIINTMVYVSYKNKKRTCYRF